MMHAEQCQCLQWALSIACTISVLHRTFRAGKSDFPLCTHSLSAPRCRLCSVHAGCGVYVHNAHIASVLPGAGCGVSVRNAHTASVLHGAGCGVSMHNAHSLSVV
eukprot:1147121-Pelagomonas_calceolata.AAC.3